MTDYAERKQTLEAANRYVKRPIEKMKLPTGRKRRFTTTTLRNAINKYFEWCEEQDEIPSIKGMMIKLNLYPETFYKMLKVEDYRPILERARLIIGEWMETDVYNTRGMAVGKINYMKNVWDWKDRTENETTVIKADLTPEMARAKIEMLAPKLLEVLQNANILNQLTHRKEVTEAEIIEEKTARRRVGKVSQLKGTA